MIITSITNYYTLGYNNPCFNLLFQLFFVQSNTPIITLSVIIILVLIFYSSYSLFNQIHIFHISYFIFQNAMSLHSSGKRQYCSGSVCPCENPKISLQRIALFGVARPEFGVEGVTTIFLIIFI